MFISEITRLPVSPTVACVTALVGMLFGSMTPMVRSVTAAEVTIALPAKSFQQIIFPLAQERGYMKEEGIDLKITFMEPTPSIQARSPIVSS